MSVCIFICGVSMCMYVYVCVCLRTCVYRYVHVYYIYVTPSVSHPIRFARETRQ